VVNPYATGLTFTDSRTRTRRDHEKYLTLIDTVAFLHQHQRERKTLVRDGLEIGYIEVTPADIAVANRLAHAVLARSMDDLSPQARKLHSLLTRMVQEIASSERLHVERVRFTRRDVRHFTGWTDFQVRSHLAQLERLEYVVAHRGSRGQLYVYELQIGSDVDQLSSLNLREYDRAGGDFEHRQGDVERRSSDNEHLDEALRAPCEPTSSVPAETPYTLPPAEIAPSFAASRKRTSGAGADSAGRTVLEGRP
jgi:hypothetical protein